MNILLDSHIAIWAILDDKRLKEKARDFLLDEGNNIYYSAATVLEVDIKSKSRNNNIEFTTDEFIDMCDQSGYIQLPLSSEAIAYANHLVWAGEGVEHRDPFDRIFLAQAIVENMHFMTHDTLISQFKQNCVILV